MNLYNIIPVLIGGFITWLVSWIFYKKAGDKLRQEATELRRLTNVILHGLENAGIVELVKDASGKPTGIIIKGSGTFAGEGWMSSKGEVIPHKSPNYNVTEANDVDSSKNPG
jgi:hypothetical protein